MNLRAKVYGSIGFVLLVLFFGINSILTHLVTSNFLGLERSEMMNDLVRVNDTLKDRMDTLAIKLSDWSHWDDTYQFVDDRNEAYILSNLNNESLALLHLNFVAILDEERHVIYKKYLRDGEERPFPESFIRYLEDVEMRSTDSVPHQGEILAPPEGIIFLERQLITSSDGQAPPRGLIVFAYVLNDEFISDLSQVTHLNIEFFRYEDATVPSDVQAAKQSLSFEQPYFVVPPKDATELSGYVLLSEKTGAPVALLRISQTRTFFQQGQESLKVFSLFIGIMSLFFIGIIFFLIENVVLKKIFRLKTEIEKIRKSGDLKAQVSFLGKDEFHLLAQEINSMLGSLHSMEMKKRESERRFRTVADSAPVMIWMLDMDTSGSYFNKGWLDFTGRPLEQELGSGWRDNIHAEHVENFFRLYEEAFSMRKPFKTECRLRRADGNYAWIHVTGVPNLSDDGALLGYIGTANDITERKIAEEDRQKYIEEIEKMNHLMVKREIKMIELKEKLAKQMGHE